MLDLKSEGLAELVGAKWQVDVRVEQHGRISTLTRPMVHPHTANERRRRVDLTSHAEPCVGCARGVEGANPGLKQDAVAERVRHKCRRDALSVASDERMTAHRSKALPPVCLDKHPFGTALDFEARTITEGKCQLADER